MVRLRPSLISFFSQAAARCATGLVTRLALAALLVCLISTLVGCANRQSQMGVENMWRSTPTSIFEVGATTQSEVMKALGPPSQVIALDERTLFYYLREQQKLKSLSIIIYSHSREQIMYDRAIFFFDKEGVLEDFALSEEEIPRRE